MNAALRLRCLARDDLAFADTLRAQEGWNQTLRDWERVLAMAPAGCFLAEWEGKPAGTATTTIYGQELAWVGMVLVQAGFRRRGIGRALLEHCLGYLRGRGVRCIKLDATPKGKPIYESLGFREEWTLRRWERERRSEQGESESTSSESGNAHVAELSAVAPLDTEVFGVERSTLLNALAQSGPFQMERNSAGAASGFGMWRPGARASYLGPIVASSAVVGEKLVEGLLGAAEADGARTFWDLPDCNQAAVACAARHGFRVQRELTRMVLGENTNPGTPERVWGLAGPEVG